MKLNRIAQEMKPIMYQAGAIAMRHFRQVDAERKPDKSYVTDADRTVEEFLREEIGRLYPECGIFGEEAGFDRMENAEYVWAIDPIDGTAPFVFELPIWGVSAGLLNKERLLAGFVYLPVVDEMYWAVDGGPAYMNGREIHVSGPVEMTHGTTILASSAWFRLFDVHYDGRILSLGSAAANLSIAARGKLHGGILETIRLYDIAGGAMVMLAAGGALKYLSGKEVDYWSLLDGEKNR